MPEVLNDGFIYGLDEFNFKGSKFGYISEDGLQPGGDNPTTTQIRAAQAHNAVVKTLFTTPGAKRFTFNLIQLKGDNFKDVFGGEVDVQGVYKAPATESINEGPATIKCSSGHTIVIPKASLTGNLANAINLAQTLAIACTIEILIPDDGGSPFQIYPPGVNPPVEG